MMVKRPRSVFPTAKKRSKRLRSAAPEKENVAGQRRASLRIQAAKQRAEKELLVKRLVELLDLEEDEGSSSRKKANDDDDDRKGKRKLNDSSKGTRELPESNEPEMKERVAKMVERAAEIDVVEKSADIKVKETIRLFNKHYLHFVQEEAIRCGTLEAEENAPKTGNLGNVKAKSKRSDLKAVSKATQTLINSSSLVILITFMFFCRLW